MIVMGLNRELPRRYVAEPRIHPGPNIEIDVATCNDEEDSDDFAAMGQHGGDNGHGGAAAAWAPARPTLAVAVEPPQPPAYEVRVYHDRPGRRRLVAAVEIVGHANKDRPEHRRAFVAKCAALLQNQVAIAIVDLVTTKSFNLYRDLLEHLGQSDPALGERPPNIYAVACRWTRDLAAPPGDGWQLQAWAHPLTIGRPLPTLPLWLAADFAVPLELEPSYEETCRVLRVP
jgi:hypothetical protein